MKKYIFLLIAAILFIGCEEENETDLSGRYNFIEPPHPTSRANRLDNSQVAFDVIFTIHGKTLTEIDLVLAAQEVSDETGSIQNNSIIIFEGGGAVLTINGVRKFGRVLQAAGAEFTINGQTKTYGPLQIDPY